MQTKKPTVFFDRDGVICEHVPYLSQISDFNLREGVGKGIAKLNASGFLTVLVTNQPMIAMGLLSLDDLKAIHQKMQDDLKTFGGHLDAIFFCPHSPDSKSPTKVADLIQICKCRKPKIGMFESAEKVLPIEKSRSYMIGDSWRDIQAARDFKIQDIGVAGGDGFLNRKTNEETKPTYIFENPGQAIDFILEREGQDVLA